MVLTLYDSLEVREQGERLKDRKRVCKDCAVLLALSGTLRETFVVTLSPEADFTCEICNVNQAVFSVSPYERGLILCDRCISDRGNKHVWSRFEIKKIKEKTECDLCGRPSEKLLIPYPRKTLPVDLEEE